MKILHRVKWLSDNGSAYIAAETAEARAFSASSCSVRSPESSGMSESFVEDTQYDFVRLAFLPHAKTILARLPGWVKDYCEVNQRSGLKFRSPLEFTRLSA